MTIYLIILNLLCKIFCLIISNTYVCYLFLCFNFKKVRLNLSHYMLFWRNLSFWGRVSFRILFTDVESRTVMKQWMLSTAFCVLKIVNFLHSCPFQLNLQPKAIMLSSVKFTWNVVFFFSHKMLFTFCTSNQYLLGRKQYSKDEKMLEAR